MRTPSCTSSGWSAWLRSVDWSCGDVGIRKHSFPDTAKLTARAVSRNCGVTVGRTFVACDGGGVESLFSISGHGANVSGGDDLLLVSFTNRVQVATFEDNAPINNRALVSGELQKGGTLGRVLQSLTFHCHFSGTAFQRNQQGGRSRLNSCQRTDVIWPQFPNQYRDIVAGSPTA